MFQLQISSLNCDAAPSFMAEPAVSQGVEMHSARAVDKSFSQGQNSWSQESLFSCVWPVLSPEFFVLESPVCALMDLFLCVSDTQDIRDSLNCEPRAGIPPSKSVLLISEGRHWE